LNKGIGTPFQILNGGLMEIDMRVYLLDDKAFK
jgi:hypothetical protein